MSDAKEEYWDNLLGGFAIVLLGVLLSASSVWGVVDNVYSMNGGVAPVLFFILGVGTILIGVFILLHTPEAQTDAV
jgi:predicted phage tail protein